MKKYLGLVLAAMLLAGCSTTGTTATTTTTAAGAEETTVATTAAAETTTAAAPAQEGEGDVDEYHVKITGYKLSKDYEGNDALIVNYDFTNNDEDTASAMIALQFKLFQDGVELEMGMSVGDDDYSSKNLMKEIKTGATLDCQSMYVLRNATSTVEIEITSLSGLFSDAPAAVTANVDLSTLK